MAYFVVFLVKVSRIPQLQTLHDPGQRHSARLDQQVDVVAHEDIRIHLKTVPLSILLQPPQVIFPVRITAENHLALIAAANHMDESLTPSLTLGNIAEGNGR